jgi:hypothetical protein
MKISQMCVHLETATIPTTAQMLLYHIMHSLFWNLFCHFMCK